MQIRSATVVDLSAITAIYEHAVLHGTASFELVPPTLQEMQARFEKVTGNGYPYLVAEMDGAVAGYAYGSAFRERPAYRWSVEDSIYLNPDFHRQGIGSALLDELLKQCAQLGFRQMIAIIGDSENHGSIGLHKALEFELVGTMKNSGQKFGRWIDTVIMQKSLGEGGKTDPDPKDYPGTLFQD